MSTIKRYEYKGKHYTKQQLVDLIFDMAYKDESVFAHRCFFVKMNGQPVDTPKDAFPYKVKKLEILPIDI